MSEVKSAKKKRKTNNKVLGNTFERKMAKSFSLWWAGDEISISRVSGSGARKHIAMYGGDLQPSSAKAEPFPFCIECKKQQRWSLNNLLLGLPGEPLFGFLGQCIEAARQAENNIPLLVCAANRQPPLVFFDTMTIHSYVPDFLKRFRAVFRFRIAHNQLPEGIRTKYHLTHLDQTLVPLQAFLTAFSRQDFQTEFVRRKRLQYPRRASKRS